MYSVLTNISSAVIIGNVSIHGTGGGGGGSGEGVTPPSKNFHPLGSGRFGHPRKRCAMTLREKRP